MKRIVIPVLMVLTLLGFAQKPDGTYMADKHPWSSDYLPATLNTMVGGQQYDGYPGPLPKLFMALGLDPEHEGIAYELQHHVLPDAANWIGMCHGWALAAINHEEPEGFVVNGIKFKTGDLKAILTSVWKNNTTIHFATPRATGVSAADFHRLVETNLTQGDSLVFDVSPTVTVWNYPVAGITKSTTSDGEWLNVEVVMHMSAFQSLTDNLGQIDLRDVPFTYRYIPGENNSYEWTGASVDNHPHNAWFAAVPYKSSLWLLTANHFYNLETLDQLRAMSAQEDNRMDLYEPNNDMANAFQVTSELVLGSIIGADRDYYKIPVAAGETRSFEIASYDGWRLEIAVLNAAGEEIDFRAATDSAVVELSSVAGEDYYIALNGVSESLDTYYRIVQDENVASLRLPATGENLLEVTAINTGETELSVINAGSVPVNGVLDLQPTSDPRASGPTVWAVASTRDSQVVKRKYHRDHDLVKPSIVPHISFKFGWDTRLEFTSRMGAETVTLNVYGENNKVLQSVALPLEAGAFSDSLSGYLTRTTRAKAGWFEVVGATGDVLFGDVIFANSVLGVESRIDMKSSPRTGELVVGDLKSAADGWTGIAMLNAAEVENEVLYRMFDDKGDILLSEKVMLQPGQKWIFTPKGLIGTEINSRYQMKVHAQYPLESVVIQHNVSDGFSYGHRLTGEKLDHFQNTFISLPQSKDDLSFLFINMGTKIEYVLLEGYNALGEFQGKFNLNLRSPLKPAEARVVPFEVLRDNGVQVKDFDAITHFKVRTSTPVQAFELYGGDGGRKSTVLPRHYVNP